jgi:hypothetical protein
MIARPTEPAAAVAAVPVKKFLRVNPFGGDFIEHIMFLLFFGNILHASGDVHKKLNNSI